MYLVYGPDPRVQQGVAGGEDPVQELPDVEEGLLGVPARVLQEVPHDTRHGLNLFRLVLLLPEELGELREVDRGTVLGVLGEVGSEHGLGEHEVLEHRTEVVEEYLARLLGVVLREFVLESTGGDLVVDLLHELLELLEGENSFLPRGFHLVETFPEPALQT